MGTENILNFGLKHNARVLVASTSEIYGDPIEHPQRESYFGNVNPIGPRGVYDEAKRYLEALTMAYHKKFNLDTIIVRIFNTYGPNMRVNDGRAIPNFINQILENKKITIYGNGSQTRSFCYVDDTINGIYEALKANIIIPLILVTKETTNELLNKIWNIIPNNCDTVYLNLFENIPKLKTDISLAKKIPNWEPQIDLREV